MRISLTLIIILIIPFASSLITQNNTLYYGIIESDGSLNTTSLTLQNTSIIGFICSASDCSTTSGTLWSGNIINLETNTSITLDYPTALQDQGYGIFFYKSDYIPYETKATWAGTGQAPDASRYLTKKRACNTPLTITSQIFNNTLNISAQIDSPIANSGPLNYIPSLISSHYFSLAQITAIIEGNINSSKSISSSIPFSGTSNVNFSFILPDGNYTLKVQSNSLDKKCLSSITNTILSNLSISNSENQSSQTNQTADIIPIISILSPLNITYNTSQILINLSSINASSILITTTNLSSFTYLFPFYLNFSDGSHTLNALANSSTGNTTLSRVSFSINTSIPQNNQTNLSFPIYLKIQNPVNNSIYSTNNLLINITSLNTTDTWFSVNNGLNITYISPIFVTFSNGSNILKAYAKNILNESTQDSVSFIVNVTGAGNQTNQSDTTPPASISNLSAIDIGTNFITWNWTNPSTPDFAYVIILLNGINVLNTTSNQYNATGLSANTSYTISIRTIDFSNNINQTAVNNTQITLSISTPITPGGGGSGGSSSNAGSNRNTASSSSRGAIYTIQNKTQEIKNNLEVTYQPSNIQKKKYNYLPLILFASVSLVLIIIIVLTPQIKRRSRARGLTRTA